MMIQSFVVSNVLYSLYDTGLANTLGLETLRHGTNLYSNFWIRIQGGDPRMGGAPFGGDGGEGLFHGRFSVFYEGAKVLNTKFVPCIPAPLETRMCSAFISMVSSANSLEYVTGIKHRVVKFIGGVSSLLSPTIRFRYSRIPGTFKEPCLLGLVGELDSRERVEAWRIGPLGTLLTGVNCGWFSRVYAKPVKVLTGLIQLVCAVALTVLYLKVIVACPYAAVAGALLA